MRGRGRGGGGGGSGRGQLPGPQRDLAALTRQEIGQGDVVSGYSSYQQIDRPPALYPHRKPVTRKAPYEPSQEQRMMDCAADMQEWSRNSAYFLGGSVPTDPSKRKQHMIAGVKRTISYLEDVLRSDLYPKELVAPHRAAATSRRSRAVGAGGAPRRRLNSVGEDLDVLAEREKAEGGETGAGDAADAAGPARRRRGLAGGDEDGVEGDALDEEAEDEEDEEDFNDYAEAFNDDDDDGDDGDDDYGGGGREAEY